MAPVVLHQSYIAGADFEEILQSSILQHQKLKSYTNELGDTGT